MDAAFTPEQEARILKLLRDELLATHAESGPDGIKQVPDCGVVSPSVYTRTDALYAREQAPSKQPKKA